MMAIQFDESDDYFTITDHADLTISDGVWSVGIWTKVGDNTGSNFQYLLSNNELVNNSFNLYLVETSNGTNPDKWVVRVQDGDGTTISVTSSSAPGADGKWRLVVAQRASSQIQLWFCEAGQTVTSQGTAPDTGLNAINGIDWMIGRRQTTSTDRYYGGIASGFFKKNGTFTSEQITAMGAGVSSYAVGGTVPLVCLPMQESADPLPELFGGHTATRNSAPTTVEHGPYTLQPSGIYVEAGVAAGADAMPMAMDHYRRIRS